jgi:hypothetical protein
LNETDRTMLVIVPRDWDFSPPDGAELLRRSPDADENHRRIREALKNGERHFFICVEGVANENCFLMATDHLDLFGTSALVGPNYDELGPRFPSLMGLYVAPEGDWNSGVVGRVPDWRLATPAEYDLLGASALVSNGIDEAEIVGHAGGNVSMFVRCHGWDSINNEQPPLEEAVQAIKRLI